MPIPAVSPAGIASRPRIEESAGVQPEADRDLTPQAVSIPAPPTNHLSLLSGVDEFRDRLKILNAPVYGTKRELFERVQKFEAKAEKQRQERHWLEERADLVAQGKGKPEMVVLKNVKEPTEQERKEHEITHLPPANYCLSCILGNSSSAPHRSHEAHKPVVPVIQLDYSFLKSSCEPQDDAEKAWATTLYAVDAPTQNGVAFSIPTKSTKVEDYSTRSVVAFIKRMAYQRCKLRPDNEPALVNMTEKIVAELKKEHIQVDLEPPARYSSQSLGAVGKFQDTHTKGI